MSKREFDIPVFDLEAVDRLTLSEHDNGLWLSSMEVGCSRSSSH
jgi:hypothetical protein